MQDRSWVWALLVLWLLALPAVSEATLLVPADLSDLVREARAIAHGRVVAVEARWADGHHRIDSLVTVEVQEYLKGNLGNRLTMRVPGGELGRYRSVMVGAPSFRHGDDVVLFLSYRGGGLPYVLGLSQGVFRVVTDEAHVSLVIPPPLVFSAGAGGQVVRGDAARRPVPLHQFTSRIREMLGEGVAGERP